MFEIPNSFIPGVASTTADTFSNFSSFWLPVLAVALIIAAIEILFGWFR